jgi:putative phosphoribosyl transferase
VHFASRTEAGQWLGRWLLDRKFAADVVLGLPRGGVVVAAAVAQALHLPLDVLAVRKIGHPRHREFAVGALAEGDVILLDEATIGHDPIIRQELEAVIGEETERLHDYHRRFHGDRPPALTGQDVLLVDDGLATGATMLVAVRSATQQRARGVFVAVPVASPQAIERLRQLADEVLALHVDPDFAAVGDYYEEFRQTTDEEVLALLRGGDKFPP